MLPPALSSLPAYRDAFRNGLANILDEAGLGATILVLANAVSDAELWAQLQSPLRNRFEHLRQKSIDRLRAGRSVNATDDDLMVFLKLMAIGFDELERTESRQEGPWELQFNGIRALRPKRSSVELVSGLRRDFDDKGFHFNKPFLQKEVFWQGELMGKPARLLYNKFPFENLHGILVPEPEANRPQFLTKPVHTYMWNLMHEMGGNIHGIRMGYNGYGALASVNHCHFQVFVREKPLAIEDTRWAHQGGEEEYPLAVMRLKDSDDAWDALASLHDRGITYNLVYGPGELWCVPRRHQGTYQSAVWSAGFSFYELTGGFLTANRDDYEQIDDEQIRRSLALLRPE